MVENFGGVAFQFASFSSGGLVDTPPHHSIANLHFQAGDPDGPAGTGYHARLQEGSTLSLEWQVVGIGGTTNVPIEFTFTTVPEPSTAWCVGLGIALLARRGARRMGDLKRARRVHRFA